MNRLVVSCINCGGYLVNEDADEYGEAYTQLHLARGHRVGVWERDSATGQMVKRIRQGSPDPVPAGVLTR